MIHRIAIYRTENGQRKFDHYATDEEMKYLRVNVDGKVEQIESADSRSELPSPNLPCFETGEWFADDDYYSGSIYSQWIDVSSTHEVEWGYKFSDNLTIYENDVTSSYHHADKAWNNVWDDIVNIVHYYHCITNNDLRVKYATVEVIGNIHENPELIHEVEI